MPRIPSFFRLQIFIVSGENSRLNQIHFGIIQIFTFCFRHKYSPGIPRSKPSKRIAKNKHNESKKMQIGFLGKFDLLF